jgi:hypothetical protein
MAERARQTIRSRTWARAHPGGVAAFDLFFGVAPAYVLLREGGTAKRRVEQTPRPPRQRRESILRSRWRHFLRRCSSVSGCTLCALCCSRAMFDRMPSVFVAAAGLVVLACSDQAVLTEATSDGLRYRAETSVIRDTPFEIRVVVTVTNASEGLERVRAGGCSVGSRVYRDPDYSNKVWDSEDEGGACPGILIEFTLLPGESGQFETTFSGVQILGDSLRPGRYYITAVTHVAGQPAFELAAGQVELSR